MSTKCRVCLVPCNRLCKCGQDSYCSKHCQKEDWPVHKSSCQVVSVGDIEYKGRGLVANRSIVMGEVILTENPLMLINFNPQSKPLSAVLKQFKKLNKKEKIDYLELGYQAVRGEKKILTIFERNCVSVKTGEEEDDWRGIYLQFSKTNHACASNSVINIIGEKRVIELVASRNIQKGEEVVVNYLNPYRGKKPSLMLRQERMRALKAHWRFSCTCPVCILTGQKLAKNEEIKNNIINLENKQEQFRNISNVHSAMNLLSLELAIFDLMVKLKDEMPREIPECLMRCFLYGKVMQIHGVKDSNKPDSFRRSAMEIAAKLGDTYLRRVMKREYEYGEFISVATRKLVKARKTKMMTISMCQP